MKERTTIRPECLRPARDFWVHPKPDAVREVLRLAKLSGSRAAKLLGLGSGETGSRTIRRYTGGEQKIPYPSWAILCEVAGLGRIWRDSSEGEDRLTNESTPNTEVGLTDLQKEAFDQAEQVIRAIWMGEREATVANISECRDALVRMRQIAHAAGLSAARDDDLGGLQRRIADAHDQLKVIQGWADLG